MAWTAPRTYVPGEILTADILNTHVRDDLRYLKGLDGTTAFSAGATFAGAITATNLVASGTYAGDNAVNKAIAHGLGVVPKMVWIIETQAATGVGDHIFHLMVGIARIYWAGGGANSSLAVTVMDSTNFYVGNATDLALSANDITWSYTWVAIGTA